MLDLSLKFLTVLFAGVTVWRALAEYKQNRIQREKDLRWKQAEAAKKIIDEWLEEPLAFNVCKMIEYENRYFTNEEGKKFHVNTELIKLALSIEQDDNHLNQVNNRYVRDAFDSFLYYCELMNQGLQSQLYLIEDLKFPLNYYLLKMKEKKLFDCVAKYAKENLYNGALRLFERMSKEFN